jgi:hypothetical protein
LRKPPVNTETIPVQESEKIVMKRAGILISRVIEIFS